MSYYIILYIVTLHEIKAWSFCCPLIRNEGKNVCKGHHMYTLCQVKPEQCTHITHWSNLEYKFCMRDEIWRSCQWLGVHSPDPHCCDHLLCQSRSPLRNPGYNPEKCLLWKFLCYTSTWLCLVWIWLHYSLYSCTLVYVNNHIGITIRVHQSVTIILLYIVMNSCCWSNSVSYSSNIYTVTLL